MDRLSGSLLQKALFILGAAVWLSGYSSAYAEDEQPVRMNAGTVDLMVSVIENESTFAKMRAADALALARVNTPEAVKALQSMLKSDYAPARACAVRALGRTRDKSRATSVLPLLADDDSVVRVEACHALAEQGAVESASSLLFDDPEPAVRLAAVQAASRLVADSAGPRLATRFNVETQPDVRTEILRALTRLDGKDGLPVAAQALGDADAGIRAAALDWFAEKAPAGADRLKPHIAGLLKDNASIVRRAACTAALYALGDAAEVSVLPFTEDPDHTVREAALLALGDKGTRASWESFFKAQGDSVRHVRRAASYAYLLQLKRTADLRSDVEQSALKAVKDSNQDRTREGVWMLGEIRSKAGFPMLLDLAVTEFPKPGNEKSAKSSKQKKRGKKQASDEKQDPAPVANTTDTRLSALIMWTVARSESSAGADLAMHYVNCPEQSLRIHAARALGVLKHEPANQLLVKLVTDTKTVMGQPMYTYNGLERTNAIWAVGEIGHPAGLAALAKLAVNERPPDSEENVALMIDILVRHKFSDKRAIDRMRHAAYKNKGSSVSVLLANGIEKLTGDRPDVPPVERVSPWNEFFLMRKEDR